MSKASRREEEKEVESGLRRLQSERSSSSAPFDYRERAQRAEEARLFLHNVVAQRGRSRDPEALRNCQIARDAMYEALNQAYPPGFWDNFNGLKKGRQSALESAVCFLEADPWFFRSGYVKADLLHCIKRMDLSEDYRSRLQQVVLHAVLGRDRRELRSYRSLAAKIASADFCEALRDLTNHQDADVRRRAAWVMEIL